MMGRNGDLFTRIFSRETGVSRPARSARRILASSQGLIERIDLHSTLVGHQDCVNAVEFSPTGDVIVSGSNDGKVSLWDWSQKKRMSLYDSGHCHNILQAKIVPFTDHWIIATSSLDGQVRLGRMLGNGRVETECLGHHDDAVHQLAFDPISSTHMLYSCGEDGFVQSYDLRCKFAMKLFRCFSAAATNRLFRKYVGLNSMAIEPRATHCVAVGGSDALVRIYDIRHCRMDVANLSCEPVNIFCPPDSSNCKAMRLSGLAYSNSGELLASYSHDSIYLFREMSWGTQALPDQVYTGHGNVMTFKGVSFFGPNDEYVVTGSDCGRIFIWRKMDAKLVRVTAAHDDIVSKISPHPQMPYLVSCGLAHDVKVWSPSGTNVQPLPDNIEQIIEGNRRRNRRLTVYDRNPNVIKQAMLVQRLAFREQVQSRN